MAKIISVYERSPREHDVQYGELIPINMSYIRWFKIAEALARLGHEVDMAIPDYFDGILKHSELSINSIVRKVPLSKINWRDYDIVKTVFHRGFETLEMYGGAGHPFIISKLGSVVGPQDLDGIYFYGGIREKLYSIQKKIHQASKYVTLLSEKAGELWRHCFGKADNILLVPGAVDRQIPPPAKNPYGEERRKRCLFAGNVYTDLTQPEANKALIDKLNQLGKLLAPHGVKLYLLGNGDVSKLDERYVTYLGTAPYRESWNYLHYADVGLVVSAGRFMHNNESSKLYYYLRAGLPVVSEDGFPNDYLIPESRLGFLVESGNLELMAQKIIEAAEKKDWDRDHARNYILTRHTWDIRAEVYGSVLKQNGME